MASVDIAAVSSESPNLQKPPAQETVMDIFSASAYGDFEKLRKFVEQDGASLSSPDGGGYYAIQWAALNNFPEIVQYIIEVFCLIESFYISSQLIPVHSLVLALDDWKMNKKNTIGY